MNDELKKQQKRFAFCLSLQKDQVFKNQLQRASIHKGFYDDLMKTENTLKKSHSELEYLKDNGIRESIYTNKKVPSNWKINLNYRQDLFNLMQKDKDFTMYISGQKKELNPFGIKNCYHTASTLPSISPERTQNQRRTTRISTLLRDTKYYGLDHIKEYSPTEVDGILDDFKEKYDIKKCYESLNEDPLDKHLPLQTEVSWIDKEAYVKKIKKLKEIELPKVHINSTMSSIRCRTQESEYISLLNSLDENKSNIKEEKPIGKIITEETEKLKNYNYKEERTKIENLKDSIYNNLLSKKDLLDIKIKIKKNKLGLREDSKEKKKPKYIIKNEYEEATKEVKITNPQIKKKLEIINYLGPRYTHCKLCHHKNLEFYQNNETNQTLNIIKFVKKDLRMMQEKYKEPSKKKDKKN